MAVTTSGDILADAIALIERGWCQRAPARSTAGEPCGPGDPSAAAWCITGAIYHRDYSASALPYFAAEKLVRATLGFDLDPKKQDSLTIWNDEPARKVEDILYALRDARASALRTLIRLAPPLRHRQLFMPDKYNEPVMIGWRVGSGFTFDDSEVKLDLSHGVFLNVHVNDDAPTIPPAPEDTTA